MHNKKNAIELLLDRVWNNGDLNLIDEMISNQYHVIFDPGDPWDGKVINTAIYRERVQLARNVFPDLKFTINDLIEEKDKVVASWFMAGTQKGDLPQLTATNNKVNVPGITIYTFDQNKVSGHWQVFDRLILFHHLGIVNL